LAPVQGLGFEREFLRKVSEILVKLWFNSELVKCISRVLLFYETEQ